MVGRPLHRGVARVSQLPYIGPGVVTPALPNRLNLTQFIQTVLVGISGLPGPMVREKWQAEDPKQPDLCVNWLSFGIENANPDANASLTTDENGVTTSQRHEELEVSCDFYGPEALAFYGIVRDGFQLPQNRYALSNALMAFVNITSARRVPDLINERFVNRRVTTVNLRREIQRLYPIPILVGVNGTIYTDLNDYQLNFSTGG